MNLKAPVLLLTLAMAASPLFAAEPNTLTDQERAAGWRLLFNGKSLDGFRGYRTEEIGAGWKAQDGAMTLTAAKSGDIMTKDAFADFELTFEWKISKSGNSGVIYRVGLGQTASHRTGPEYQILDNVDAKDNKLGNHLAGSLYDIGREAPRDLVRPVGEWNSSRLVAKGWKVEHWLNGKQVIALDLASAEGKAAIAASKFKNVATFASLAQGHIAFQDHGDVVSYRSIKLRELK